MKIGIFTDTYEPATNGVVTSVKTMKKALEMQGHTVYLIAPSTNKIRYNVQEFEIFMPSIKIKSLDDNRVSGIYPLRVVRKIRSWDLDVIHSHTEFSIGMFARLFGKQHNIPIVYTYHTLYEDYTHYLSRGFKILDPLALKIIIKITKIYCEKNASLIVPTEKTKKVLESYGLNKEMHVVPTGIDLLKFKKYSELEVNLLKKMYNIDKIFTALYVGRHSKEKNIEFLIEKFKNSKGQLIIVGDGPDHELLLELAAGHENIIFVGRIPWDKVNNYYHACDVFLTSSQTETQGLTVIEALACNLPVLCIDDESFNNVIFNGYNGYLFTDDFEEKLELIKINYHEIMLNVEKSVKEYSLEKFAENLVNVYKEVLKSQNKEESNKLAKKRLRKISLIRTKNKILFRREK